MWRHCNELNSFATLVLNKMSPKSDGMYGEHPVSLTTLATVYGGSHHLFPNRLVSQMWAPLAACREPAGKLWQLCKVLYVFEHKTQYLLIHAPFTRIVVFCQIGNVPPMI